MLRKLTQCPSLIAALNGSRTLSASSTTTKKQIEALVKSNNVILKYHGLSFNAFNVLDDESLRQGIKDYSDWPTIPQLFVNGEFVGGADIVLEMHKNGQLLELLRKAGITSSVESDDKK
uniref:Glutaredoxin domain-containing protein n=1 Tax=Trichuris muris TaxID=70415 RepID=A0A5S6Q9B8_TRIMR